MAAYNKFNQFVQDLARGVHDLSADTLRIYLSNAVPSSSADAVKADLAEIAGGSGYTAGGVTLSITSCNQVGGVLTLICADPGVITASGGSIGPFQYAVLYNDTPTSPADPLIAWWDRGAVTTALAGDTITIDLDQVGGVLTIT